MHKAHDDCCHGSSAVAEAMVTGETMPVEKAPGATHIGGTVNGTGALVIEARRVAPRR